MHKEYDMSRLKKINKEEENEKWNTRRKDEKATCKCDARSLFHTCTHSNPLSISQALVRKT